jgi:hypothetical protein
MGYLETHQKTKEKWRNVLKMKLMLACIQRVLLRRSILRTNGKSLSCPLSVIDKDNGEQGDQIGRIFAYCAVVFFGQFSFTLQKLPIFSAENVM